MVEPGLSLSNALPNSANYSVETIFNFSALGGFRKILDFKDRSSDNGLHTLNTALNFFPVVTGPSVFAPNGDVRLIVTRDGATNQFAGYINGLQQITSIDSSARAVFTGPSNIIQFFKDDFVTGQGKASAGAVDLIRIYNAPLSPTAIAALGGPGPVAAPVPEPSTVVLFSLGLVVLVGYVRWQRRSVELQVR